MAVPYPGTRAIPFAEVAGAKPKQYSQPIFATGGPIVQVWLKAVVGLVLAVAALVAFILIGARFADGPLEVIAGGPFTSGTLHQGPMPDWSFVKDLETIEMQSLNPARSRTTWVLYHEGRIFVPCGFMDSFWGRIWKRWPIEAQRDGRVITRVNDKLYEQNLVRIERGEILEPVLAELSRKYVGQPIPLAAVASGALWIFELTPRA